MQYLIIRWLSTCVFSTVIFEINVPDWRVITENAVEYSYLSLWKFCFLNRSIPCQRHSDKVCPYKKTNKQTNKQKLQPRIEPGLENLTHPITSTLPRRHNSKQEKFDYVIILSYPLVIQSITFDLLFKFSLKKENLILVLLFPVSGGTTRTTFGSFQLQQNCCRAHGQVISDHPK